MRTRKSICRRRVIFDRKYQRRIERVGLIRSECLRSRDIRLGIHLAAVLSDRPRTLCPVANDKLPNGKKWTAVERNMNGADRSIENALMSLKNRITWTHRRCVLCSLLKRGKHERKKRTNGRVARWSCIRWWRPRRYILRDYSWKTYMAVKIVPFGIQYLRAHLFIHFPHSYIFRRFTFQDRSCPIISHNKFNYSVQM